MPGQTYSGLLAFQMRPRTFEFDVTDGNGAYVCLEAMPNKPGSESCPQLEIL